MVIIDFLRQFLSTIYFPKIGIGDIVEIAILTVLLYMFIDWIQRTRAYMLLRGIFVVFLFVVICIVFNFNAILWVLQQLASVGLLSLVIIFSPELRKALESLGNNGIFSRFIRLDGTGERNERFPDSVINDIVSAVSDMSEEKTGALIVIEQNIMLNEYVETGIRLDSLVSRQLLVNIFEHNTPLHDGAVIIRKNRVIAATCYLPLSENRMDKNLGTRHRAGVGISEVTDSLTIIVSEETGEISLAYRGALTRSVTEEMLRERLVTLQNKEVQEARYARLLSRKGKEKNKDADPENLP